MLHKSWSITNTLFTVFAYIGVTLFSIALFIFLIKGEEAKLAIIVISTIGMAFWIAGLTCFGITKFIEKELKHKPKGICNWECPFKNLNNNEM